MSMESGYLVKKYRQECQFGRCATFQCSESAQETQTPAITPICVYAVKIDYFKLTWSEASDFKIRIHIQFRLELC